MCLLCRFNMLNNWMRGHERIDVWLSRFSPAAKHFYWGFAHMSIEDAQATLNATRVRPF